MAQSVSREAYGGVPCTSASPPPFLAVSSISVLMAWPGRLSHSSLPSRKMTKLAGGHQSSSCGRASVPSFALGCYESEVTVAWFLILA